MRIMFGGLIGGVIAVFLSLVVNTNLGICGNCFAIAIGGFCSGYIARRKGWLSGLLVGFLDVGTTLFVLFKIGESAKLSESSIFNLIIHDWKTIIVPVPIGVIAAISGEKWWAQRLTVERRKRSHP